MMFVVPTVDSGRCKDSVVRGGRRVPCLGDGALRTFPGRSLGLLCWSLYAQDRAHDRGSGERGGFLVYVVAFFSKKKTENDSCEYESPSLIGIGFVHLWFSFYLTQNTTTQYINQKSAPVKKHRGMLQVPAQQQNKQNGKRWKGRDAIIDLSPRKPRTETSPSPLYAPSPWLAVYIFNGLERSVART